jgi:hypothetical protein
VKYGEEKQGFLIRVIIRGHWKTVASRTRQPLRMSQTAAAPLAAGLLCTRRTSDLAESKESVCCRGRVKTAQRDLALILILCLQQVLVVMVALNLYVGDPSVGRMNMG